MTLKWLGVSGNYDQEYDQEYAGIWSGKLAGYYNYWVELSCRRNVAIFT